MLDQSKMERYFKTIGNTIEELDRGAKHTLATLVKNDLLCEYHTWVEENYTGVYESVRDDLTSVFISLKDISDIRTKAIATLNLVKAVKIDNGRAHYSIRDYHKKINYEKLYGPLPSNVDDVYELEAIHELYLDRCNRWLDIVAVDISVTYGIDPCSNYNLDLVEFIVSVATHMTNQEKLKHLSTLDYDTLSELYDSYTEDKLPMLNWLSIHNLV